MKLREPLSDKKSNSKKESIALTPVQKSTPTKLLKKLNRTDYDMPPLVFNMKFNNYEFAKIGKSSKLLFTADSILRFDDALDKLYIHRGSTHHILE